MPGLRKRGESIRRFILENIEKHPSDIARITAEKFDISRQAVNRHLTLLTKQKAIVAEGATNQRIYKLHPEAIWDKTYYLNDNLAEDAVWRKDIEPLVNDLPDNVNDILHYGFTEMLNNVIDHSSSDYARISLERTALETEIRIFDNGVGIFRKIKDALNLEDERHAVLELAKGKLTTDPKNHTGEGIFFSSRVFDNFAILSGDVYFTHEFHQIEDWILESGSEEKGTAVLMKLNNNSARTTTNVFVQYTTDDDFQFSKTVVPVKLAQYGDELLVSRSQAKRLLTRVDKFKVVIFDFDGVDNIGQAFADEIFRVFRNNHPGIELCAIKINDDVSKMIARAEQID